MSDQLERRRVRLRGPSRYCPDCQRMLVAITDTEDAIISGGVTLRIEVAESDAYVDGGGVLTNDSYGFTATCDHCEMRSSSGLGVFVVVR